MCDPIYFPNVTPEVFADICARVEAGTGAQIAGNLSGRIEHSGCAFQWVYDVAAQQLRVQCVNKPFFFPCESVNAKLEELFTTGGTGGA